MRVTLINHPQDHICAEAASMCYKAKNGYKAMSAAIESGHESVLEHCVFTFLVEDVSRVLLAQLTRHRIASFSVESQRYCGANMQCVIPETIRGDTDIYNEAMDLQSRVEDFYKKATEKGVPAEDARYFTLQGGLTSLVFTMNARELRHFLSLRCCHRAQWEIRQMADEIFWICQKAAPQLFVNAGPGCVRGACPEGKRSCNRPRKDLIIHGKTE